MNFYNPYYSMYPYLTTAARPGLFSRLLTGLRGLNFSSILSGTQKTLGVVNQAIPLVKQASPIFKNAKTMFKVMNEFKRVDTPNKTNSKNNITNSENKEEINQTKTIQNDGPTFFL